MKTELLSPTDSNIKKAADFIKRGEVVAFPTETVYGIGATLFDSSAVSKIFRIKNRNYSKPLSAHISDINMVEMLCSVISSLFYELANCFWPGPLTIIIPANDNIPKIVNNDSRTIAIRFPDNDICKVFIDNIGCPLAATSANISGNHSPINAHEVLEELIDRIPLIIDGSECKLKQESTIVSLIDEPKIIREGVITLKQLEEKTGRRFKLQM